MPHRLAAAELGRPQRRRAPQRRRLALQSVSQCLVDRDLRLIKLLWPPFDSAPWDPGYIRGYVPGVRENGGQYTHAAVWVAMAWATLGRPAEAWQLFDLLNPIRHADSAGARPSTR